MSRPYQQDLQVTTLPNGIRVATDPMPQLRSASLGVWIDAGSRLETAAENGAAHFLEHMLFKGTTTRTARQIAEQIEDVGGYLNAHTGREQTGYHARLLAEHVPLGLEIISDLLSNSLFDAEEFERERAVILQEIGEAEDTPDDIIFDHLQGLVWPDQPLGRPILGTAESLAGLTPDSLRGFVARQYRPERMVVAAAGQVEHQHILDLAERWFGSWPVAPATPEAPAPARWQGGLRTWSEDLESAHLALAFPGVDHQDAELYTVMVLSTLLGGGMSSRLFQEVRERRGLAYSVYSYHSSYRDGGLNGIYAACSGEKLAETLTVIRAELEDAVAKPGGAEVQRAIAQAKAGLLMALESSGHRAEALASQILMYGQPLDLEKVVARVEAVTPAAVHRVGERLFSQPSALAVLAPEGARLDEDHLAALSRPLPAPAHGGGRAQDEWPR